MIKVVGLGIAFEDISLRGALAIMEAEKVIVKTALSDTYSFFVKEEIEHCTCDDIYNSVENFDCLNKEIAKFVADCSGQNVCFCVDGSGLDDRSVIELKKLCEIEIIPGVSRESFCIKDFPATAFNTLSAYDLMDDNCFAYATNQTFVVKDIDNNYMAGVVKESLSRLVGDEKKIWFVNNKGKKEIFVYELDRIQDLAYDCAVVVEGESLLEKEVFNYQDLMRIMYRLRGKNGCDWDREQTHKSIRNNMIEEAYELVEAINNDDIDNIVEECGDVLLQSVFHTVIGEDEGEFESKEVITALCKKLISRHTHIFGDVVAENSAQALQAWENAKTQEKKYTTNKSKIEGIAKSLPKLMLAEKINKIASSYGVSVGSTKDCEIKVLEELTEFLSADEEDKELEGGDLLLACVTLMASRGVKCEVALGRSLDKFVRRFSYIENKCIAENIDFKNLKYEDKNILWKEAKTHADR